MAGTPPHLAQVLRLGAALGGRIDRAKVVERVGNGSDLTRA